MKEVLILFIAYRKVKCINRIIFTIFLIIIIIINKMFDNIENKSINMFLKYMVAKKGYILILMKYLYRHDIKYLFVI
ncbi:hypothetical protein C9J19_01675 [Photobacterium phosphoreum]|nr:hypothetical protein [Photobacterium phosphoreum]PSU67105.1 hypothetical protein CTM79_17165 [Photobacterium phosphoreum]PSW17328.1 hypothetical protein C9J20_01730 [Photobacterium phosphoreum]PSW30522.1 hypothetical protein C9J19_01675 [Photobacterium phosphoreum]